MFGLDLPAWIIVLRLCRSLDEEMILSQWVGVNHDLFIGWIISQLHTEWCGAWWDENGALRWHRCSVITQWKSCYLPTLLKMAHSCCLRYPLSLSDSLACLPPCTPGSVFVLWFTKYRYFVQSCVDMKMHFSPGWISLRMNDLWSKLFVWHIMTEHWRQRGVCILLFFSKSMWCLWWTYYIAVVDSNGVNLLKYCI